MQSALQKAIRQNLDGIVFCSNNFEQVLKLLVEKEVFTADEEFFIADTTSALVKKSVFFYLITEQEDRAFEALIESLNSTENKELSQCLLKGLSQRYRQPSLGPDHEGIAIADEIDKQFEEIATYDDDPHDVDIADSRKEWGGQSSGGISMLRSLVKPPVHIKNKTDKP